MEDDVDLMELSIEDVWGLDEMNVSHKDLLSVQLDASFLWSWILLSTGEICFSNRFFFNKPKISRQTQKLTKH